MRRYHSLLVAWTWKIRLVLSIVEFDICRSHWLLFLALLSFGKKLGWLLSLFYFISRCFDSIFIQIFELLDGAFCFEGGMGIWLQLLLLISLWVHHVGKEAILRTHWSMCMRTCPLFHPRWSNFWRSKLLSRRCALLYWFWSLIFIDHLLLVRGMCILCPVHRLYLIQFLGFRAHLLSAIADSWLLFWLHLHDLNLFCGLIFWNLHELVVLFIV